MTLAVNVGRPRKPTALKELEGTARPDRANPSEPTGDPITIGPPPAGASPEVATAWQTFAPMINEMKICLRGDVPAFLELCEAWAHVRKTFQDHEAKPADKTGAQKNLLLWLTQFGLTPSARARVSQMAKSERADPLAKFTVYPGKRQ
jgi:phage terminase small subunit